MADVNSLPTLSVADLLEQYPQAVSLFIRYRMACVGCDIAAFHTVAEAAAIYGVDAGRFCQELGLGAQGCAQAKLKPLSEESK